MKDKKAAKAAPITYTKQQLLSSKRYANRRDLVGALLDDDGEYTIDAVDAAIKNYMKGKVN